jgi:hypothetical protein
MVSTAASSAEQSASTAANRRALTHLLGEFERARVERDAAENRLKRFAETIQLLLTGLPIKERDNFSRRFEEIKSGIQNRGGELFGNVIALFKRDRREEWTIPEIHAALEKEGVPPDPKALLNTIAYLAKTGRLRRISRGQYVVTDYGIGIEMEGAGHGISRTTEHDY